MDDGVTGITRACATRLYGNAFHYEVRHVTGSTRPRIRRPGSCSGKPAAETDSRECQIIVTTISPMPSIRASRRSPRTAGPTPAGVPVKIRSPTPSVTRPERYETVS